MKKKKVKSFEKFFKEYLKKKAPFHGVMNLSNYVSKKTKGLIMGNPTYVIIDENLQVIWSNKAYDNSGNYHPKVRAKIKELKIKGNTHTDCDLEDFILHKEVEAFISWSPYIRKNLERVPDDELDVEPNSPEFDEFMRVLSYIHYCTTKRKLDNAHPEGITCMPVEFYRYTEKGQKEIEGAIKWVANLKSPTPIQDAWFKVLKKDGIKVNWEPFNLLNNEYVIKTIDYSSLEELEVKRKKEDEEFKKSLTPETKKMLKEIAKTLSEKK